MRSFPIAIVTALVCAAVVFLPDQSSAVCGADATARTCNGPDGTTPTASPKAAAPGAVQPQTTDSLRCESRSKSGDGGMPR